MLLPNNRARRAVTDAFVRASGGGLLLPRLVAIGDVEAAEGVGALLDPAGAEPVPPAVAPLHRRLVLARLVASMVTAMAVGWMWTRRSDSSPPHPSAEHEHPRRWAGAVQGATGDLGHALGLLVLGAGATAAIKLELPPRWLELARHNTVTAVVVLAVLAVVLAVCSEADAFIAASFGQFSSTAQLAFMVVGPMIDLKLFAMQWGTFGPKFALRLAPITFATAVAASVATSALLL